MPRLFFRLSTIGIPPTACTFLFFIELQHRHERLGRHRDGTERAHALFAFLLFFEELLLSCDIAAVALGEHVFSKRLDRLAGDDLAADGSLHRNFEHLAWDILLELFADLARSGVGVVREQNKAQRVDDLAV